MNDYKVIYNAGTTEDGYDIVTELTEAAARKFFNHRHKGEGLEIIAVELHRENTNATKQQERDALEAIKKIVAGLGPQSYLATAFEGCFRDAEDNIEDDAAYSMKDRWESAEQKLTEAKQEAERLRLEIKALEDVVRNRGDVISQLNARIPLEDDLDDAVRLMDEKVYSLKEAEEAAAKIIVEKATEPDSPEFKQAVTDNRNARKTAEYYTNVMKRLADTQKHPA